MKKLFFFELFLLLNSAVIFGQGIPQTINYQGVLKDASGSLVANGDYNLTFRLYEADNSKNPVWTEVRLITIADGIVNTQLGALTPLEVTFDREYWLGITVESEAELNPRIKLNSVPYSFMTMNVMDGSITSSKIAEGEVVKSINTLKDSVTLSAGTNITIIPSGNILTISASGGGEGTITGVTAGNGLTGGGSSGNVTLSVPDNGITAVMLSNNSVNEAKITDGSVTSTDILDGTVTSMDISTGQIVKSLNTLKDSVTLLAGTNISITPAGNNLTISSTSSGIGGTGSAGYISKFTGATAIANSNIFETADGKIGIGTTVPGAILDIPGNDALINGLTLGKGTNNINTNTALGYHTLFSTTAGFHNVAIGYASLRTNETGNYNTSAGVWSLQDNTTGSGNTAFGYSSLTNNITAGENTALGGITLVSNTTGQKNTAVGSGSLWSNVGNHGSTSIGYHAMYYADSKEIGVNTGNTAVGYLALQGSTIAAGNTGTNNTAVGSNSLTLNSSGFNNTAVGFSSLITNDIGSHNVAVGSYSLYTNKSSNNTSMGANSAYLNSSGISNTTIGMYSMYENTSGSFNTAVGYDAGAYANTVDKGSFLGYECYTNVSGLTNVTGLGYDARPTASNQVRIGNSAVTSIGGYAPWTDLSDGRYKTDVQENVKGLNFIMNLRPVTYKLDVNKLAADLKEDIRRNENGNTIQSVDEYDNRARNEKSQITYTGFIGQEVEKAAKDAGYDFSGIEAPKNANDFYGLRYSEFVAPLVKAVQEQQKMIEELKKEIELLKGK